MSVTSKPSSAGQRAADGRRARISGSPLLTPCMAASQSSAAGSSEASSPWSSALEPGWAAPGRAAATASWSSHETAFRRASVVSGTRPSAASRAADPVGRSGSCDSAPAGRTRSASSVAAAIGITVDRRIRSPRRASIHGRHSCSRPDGRPRSCRRCPDDEDLHGRPAVRAADQCDARHAGRCRPRRSRPGRARTGRPGPRPRQARRGARPGARHDPGPAHDRATSRHHQVTSLWCCVPQHVPDGIGQDGRVRGAEAGRGIPAHARILEQVAPHASRRGRPPVALPRRGTGAAAGAASADAPR